MGEKSWRYPRSTVVGGEGSMQQRERGGRKSKKRGSSIPREQTPERRTVSRPTDFNKEEGGGEGFDYQSFHQVWIKS